MCSWKIDKDNLSHPVIDKLESEHQSEQAATIDVFNLKVTCAVSARQIGMCHMNFHKDGNVNSQAISLRFVGYCSQHKVGGRCWLEPQRVCDGSVWVYR